jgi:hypothetical protein
MTLPTIDQARSWRGLTLVATDDEPVGKIEAIYVDRTTRQPEWALVNTGLFGSSRTFVPLADAAQRGDTVQVPHETSVVREAPRLDQDTELSEEDEARLYAHYGIQYTTEESSSGLPVGETASGDGGPAADDWRLLVAVTVAAFALAVVCLARAAGRVGGPAAAAATTELPPSSRLEADLPAASMLPGTARTTATPAATSWSDATTSTDADNAGEPKGGRGKKAAAAGGQAARKAVQAGQQAAASGRVAAHKASREVAAVVAAIETTPESKHKARKRARARKRAMAAAAGAARSVAAALGVTWRRVRKSDVG